jgi:hypothetical protein
MALRCANQHHFVCSDIIFDACSHPQHNIITVIMQAKNLDIAGAMAWYGGYRKHLADEFIDLYHNIPSFDKVLDRRVRAYVKDLANWPRANYCYSFECPRYFGSEREKVQETREIVLELQPRYATREDNMV